MQASGPFEVKLAPMAADERPGAAFLGRLSIDKTFSGALQATSVGQMLAAQTGTTGSAGYVALEQVTGTLDGRAGSFILQHFGLADRGATQLTVSVVPDSGTGELTGLTGTMQIVIEAGKHSYSFDYSLPS